MAIFVCYTTLHTGQDNQIVHDSTDFKLSGQMWRMKFSYENEAKKMYESPLATKIFLTFKMLCHE